jgi:cobalt-zinc-cadmium resistance protein CzcA
MWLSKKLKNVLSKSKTLPEGVLLNHFETEKMVNNSISTVEKNLLEGAHVLLF